MGRVAKIFEVDKSAINVSRGLVATAVFPCSEW
jgi:hypothetical protein